MGHQDHLDPQEPQVQAGQVDLQEPQVLVELQDLLDQAVQAVAQDQAVQVVAQEMVHQVHQELRVHQVRLIPYLIIKQRLTLKQVILAMDISFGIMLLKQVLPL
jgi:adenosine deaminase